MFEQSLLEAPGRARRATSTAIAVSGQAAVAGVALLIPLVWIERLPLARLEVPVQSPPPPSPVKIVGTVVSRVLARPYIPGRLYEHQAIPAEIPNVDDLAQAPALAPGSSRDFGVPGGVGLGTGLGVLSEMIRNLPVPSEDKPATTQAVDSPKPRIDRIKVGGAVQAARIRRQVMPVYPPLAKQARISGTVLLEGIISREGSIENLRVLSGHPLLIPAALDAVRQWLSHPTLLNGDPVEVVAPIEVHFRLSN